MVTDSDTLLLSSNRKSFFLLSNGTISNVVLCDLNPAFLAQHFETLISRKRRERAQKFIILFVSTDICRGKVLLQMF